MKRDVDIYFKKAKKATFIYIGNMQRYSYVLGDFVASEKTQDVNRFRRCDEYLK